MSELLLKGLDGGNPLGFLAALGVLRTLEDGLPGKVRLAWTREGGGWRPRLHIADGTEGLQDAAGLAQTLAGLLGVPRAVADESDIREVGRLDGAYRAKKKELEKLEKELKKTAKEKKLKGKEVDEYIRAETLALREEAEELRQRWLTKLRIVVPSPELGLGKTLSVTPEELRGIGEEVAESVAPHHRLVADLLAAFGSETCARNNRIDYTAFCFVSGSGNQYFLDTIAKLLAVVTEDRLQQALFEPWTYGDEKLSLRLDPQDDRRHALMWENPTADGNEAKTVWAANLLAYRALSLLPAFPVGGILKTTGFDAGSRVFTWPLWTDPLPCPVAGSLLSLAALASRPLDRGRLLSMGIEEVYEAERIQVGTPPLMKINFGLPVVAQNG